MRFSEMQYVRPDVESIKEQSERIKLDFSSADSLEAADKAFLEWDRLTAHTDTMTTLI